MKFRKAIEFAGTPEEVFAMLTDRDFREKVAREAGAESWDVQVTPRADGGVDTALRTSQPTTDMPPLAKKFLGDSLKIHQEEHWTSSTSGTLTVAIPGAPGTIGGSISLAPSATGTTQVVESDIKVGIPLIGGKIEKLIGSVLGNVLKLQGRIGNDWLAGAH